MHWLLQGLAAKPIVNNAGITPAGGRAAPALPRLRAAGGQRTFSVPIEFVAFIKLSTLASLTMGDPIYYSCIINI
jgi:hypothetical protein